MPNKRLSNYVFRGTTINWPGNNASKKLPRTPTTSNPIKALLFAMASSGHGHKTVIYIVNENKLGSISFDKNVLAKTEEEKGYIITPLKFIKLAEGYITTEEAIEILHQLKLPIPMLTDKSLFDFSLSEIMRLSKNKTDEFYNLAKPLLKNT